MASETSIALAFALFILVNMWVRATNAIFDILNSGAFGHSFSTSVTNVLRAAVLGTYIVKDQTVIINQIGCFSSYYCRANLQPLVDEVVSSKSHHTLSNRYSILYSLFMCIFCIKEVLSA